MFKKDFKVIGNTKLKKALLKKVHTDAKRSLDGFSNLTEEERALLIPNKAGSFEITKLKGSRISFYSHNDVPILIDTNSVRILLYSSFFLFSYLFNL